MSTLLCQPFPDKLRWTRTSYF